jgi:hypothetical protein
MTSALELQQHKCESCGLHAYADQHPKSLIARLWRWHTTWCPGWKSYQRWKSERERAASA